MSRASTGLCGGRRVTTVPTATSRPPGRLFAPVRYRGQHAKADEGVGRGPGVRPTVRAEHSFPAEDLGSRECLSTPARA